MYFTLPIVPKKHSGDPLHTCFRIIIVPYPIVRQRKLNVKWVLKIMPLSLVEKNTCIIENMTRKQTLKLKKVPKTDLQEWSFKLPS